VQQKQAAEKKNRNTKSKKATEEAAEEAAANKKPRRVSFGGLDVENPDQVKMDAEAKVEQGEKRLDKKARADAKRAHKLLKKSSPKHKKKGLAPKKK
jgi:hypothetical protein